jgi:RNA polymerase subunit RPABC4/transcription elongation factor Spt4
MTRKVCKKCNIETRTTNWSQHLRSKNHANNDPDQIVKPQITIKVNKLTKVCKKCDVEFASANPTSWNAHIKSSLHLRGETDKSRKVCAKCNIEIMSNNWKRHLKSKTHLQNDS